MHLLGCRGEKNKIVPTNDLLIKFRREIHAIKNTKHSRLVSLLNFDSLTTTSPRLILVTSKLHRYKKSANLSSVQLARLYKIISTTQLINQGYKIQIKGYRTKIKIRKIEANLISQTINIFIANLLNNSELRKTIKDFLRFLYAMLIIIRADEEKNSHYRLLAEYIRVIITETEILFKPEDFFPKNLANLKSYLHSEFKSLKSLTNDREFYMNHFNTIVKNSHTKTALELFHSNRENL